MNRIATLKVVFFIEIINKTLFSDNRVKKTRVMFSICSKILGHFKADGIKTNAHMCYKFLFKNIFQWYKPK